MMRAFTAAAAVLAIAALAGAAPAKTPGLTAAEKQALDIVSVQAIGAGNAGLIVTATFRGNIERALGRGHLQRGLVALVLPAGGLVTQGSGAVGATSRRGLTSRAGVLRNGKQLIFFVGGAPGPLDRVVVKTFAVAPTGKAARRLGAARGGDPPLVSPTLWEELEKRIGDGEATLESPGFVAVLSGEADCMVRRLLPRATKHMKASSERLSGELAALDKDVSDAIRQLERGSTPTAGDLGKVARTISDLVGKPIDVRALGGGKALLAKLKQVLRLVKSLKTRNDSLTKATEAYLVSAAVAPDGPCAINATFTREDRTTTYSWPGDYETGVRYEWNLLPPANDPNCNNFQRLKGIEKEFPWAHPDSVCDHTKEDPDKGHIGSIALSVGFGPVKCKAVYLGTFTGTGPRGSCEGG